MTLQLAKSKIFADKNAANALEGGFTDQNGIGFSRALHSGGTIQRIPDGKIIAMTREIADDDGAGVNPDTHG